jgi:ferritin
MLSEKVNKALNNQIAMEAYASNAYLAIASWAEQKGFEGTARFFYNQSDEERIHMMKIFRFVNEAEGHALSPAVEQPQHEFPNYKSVFETALQHEKKVTKSINELLKIASDENDYRTQNMLQWFVDEQLEEENQIQIILDKLNLIGDNGLGYFMIDAELGKKVDAKETGDAE